MGFNQWQDLANFPFQLLKRYQRIQEQACWGFSFFDI